MGSSCTDGDDAPIAGSKTPQRFIAYGLMIGAPLFNDNLVNTRKDYTYMEPTTGKPHCLFMPGKDHLESPPAQPSPPPADEETPTDVLHSQHKGM